MKNISAEELHSHLLRMMKQFHSFCEDNNITYYIVGGTALGAQRHQGFIPWDDDVDISMPRTDYEKLISLMEKLPNNLELLFYRTRQHTPFHYIKLVDNTTTLVEKYYPDSVEGLYIDIYPLDGAFRETKGDVARRRKAYRLFKKIVFHYAKLEKPSTIERFYSYYCRLVNVDKLHNKLHTLMTEVTIEDGDSMTNLLSAYSEREVVDKKVYGTPVLYNFEDTQFYGPADMDAYLRKIYGDYMKLPSPEQQVFKHGYLYLNLNEPYSKFGGLDNVN